MSWLISNWDAILTVCGFLGSAVAFTVYLVKRLRALKGAKTQGERDAIINELKSSAYGLVAVAEQTFKDVPKSGGCKILYVLNHIKALCGDSGVEYDESFWKEFIDEIVGRSNDVITATETSKAIDRYINKVKENVPYYIDDANKLFEVIPDSAEYKIEYILKLIRNDCAKHAINVYDVYDWRTYVNALIAEAPEAEKELVI